MQAPITNADLRRVVRIVAVLNLGYFGVEPSPLPSARSHCSPTVSTSFEDASVNFLILVALGWTVRNRARVGMMLAGILLGARPRDPLDCMAETQCPGAAGTIAAIAR
jgi:hypothetical protein